MCSSCHMVGLALSSSSSVHCCPCNCMAAHLLCVSSSPWGGSWVITPHNTAHTHKLSYKRSHSWREQTETEKVDLTFFPRTGRWYLPARPDKRLSSRFTLLSHILSCIGKTIKTFLIYPEADRTVKHPKLMHVHMWPVIKCLMETNKSM